MDWKVFFLEFVGNYLVGSLLRWCVGLLAVITAIKNPGQASKRKYKKLISFQQISDKICESKMKLPCKVSEVAVV